MSDQNLVQLSYFEVENSRPEPNNKTPTFYSARFTSGFSFSSPTLLSRDQFPLFELSVFCCSLLLVIALEWSPDKRPVISSCPQSHKGHFVQGAQRLKGGIHHFIEPSSLTRPNVENKQGGNLHSLCSTSGYGLSAPPCRYLICCTHL